jgi:anion-transporting  ArsA/GET3 family ATPase
MALDTETTFDQVVERHAPSEAIRERILGSPLYRQVASRLAGVHEYMAMEKLLELHHAARYDLIVLDTPPTQDALDFLSAPERMVAALDSRFLRAFGSSGTNLRAGGLIARGFSRVLGAMARITGRELLTDLSEFLADLNGLFGGFRARAERVAAAFRGDGFGFVLVSTPGGSPSEEALRLAARLASDGMALDAFVVNRCRREPAAANRTELERELQREFGWPAARARAAAEGALLATREATLSSARDREQVARIAQRLDALGESRPPLVEVAELPEDRVGVDALTDVARDLERRAAGG